MAGTADAVVHDSVPYNFLSVAPVVVKRPRKV